MATAAAIGFGVWIYREGRPETRRPGEDLPEITRRLAADLPADAPTPRFTDVTSEAGLDEFRTFDGARTSQLPEDMGAGAAWGDFDGDGDDDLFLVGAGGTMGADPASWASSELYENRGDGMFRKAEFPEVRILGMSAAWGDVDGDGRLDLAVTGYDSILLFRNREGGFERDESLTLPGYWAGASWADFDNDGDLDLYVCGYVKYEPGRGGQQRASDQYGTAVPYTLNPASFEPERNLLFENSGNGEFSEVALLYGVSNPGGRSLSALWRDFDDDGRLDLYVANDISDNALFLNRGESFDDAGLAAFVADYRGAMGLAAGDWNRDGDDDLFVTHWIAQENALYDSRLAAALPAQQEGGDDRRRPLTFSDVAAPKGLGQIALQSIGWGAEFIDFDHDGWLDLVVANGSTFETDDQPPELERQAAFLLWNRRGEGFHDLAPLSEPFAKPRVGRGLAVSDYDRDGDVDLLLVTLDEGVRLLRNDMAAGNWIEVSLERSGGWAGSTLGTTAIATVGGTRLRRAASSASYLSQSSAVLHFGLGEATLIDELEVHWLGGESESFAGLEANARWEVVEGDPRPTRLTRLSRREWVTAFWKKQRAAMNAMKRDGDPPRAIVLFREALELNPEHEYTRYYLANLISVEGDLEAAQAELERLLELNPKSHRGHKQQGLLKAIHASGEEYLDEAERALERALAINPEETGTLLALGELALLRGDHETADERFEWVCRTNPRATGGFYLRGYLSWLRGERDESVRLLAAAREARGEEWKPEGAAAEGDVLARMHREESPLSRFWEQWDGGLEPEMAFSALSERLEESG